MEGAGPGEIIETDHRQVAWTARSKSGEYLDRAKRREIIRAEHRCRPPRQCQKIQTGAGAGPRNEDYVMTVLVAGLTKRIERAKADGFDWIVPKNDITMKTGLIPAEISVNMTSFHRSGPDERVRSRAEIEIRKQAYGAFDFLKRYERGFENSIFLEVAPKVGIRQTRRVLGRCLLTKMDVRGHAHGISDRARATHHSHRATPQRIPL